MSPHLSQPADFYAVFWAYGKWRWADLRTEEPIEIARGARPGYATEAEAREAADQVAASYPISI